MPPSSCLFPPGFPRAESKCSSPPLECGAFLVVQQWHRVSGCGTKDAIFTRRIAHCCHKLTDRLVAADMFDLDHGRDRLADAYSLDETPVRFEEDGAGPRKIFGDDCVQ